MDIILGAAAVLVGLVADRLLQTFWPSREAERQREAEREREEREARRRHRADLVKPLINILDGVSIRTQKAQVSEMIQKLARDIPEAKEKIEEFGVTSEYVEKIFGDESRKLSSDHAYRVIEEEMPLVSRVTDDGAQSAIRKVLIISLIPGALGSDLGRQAARDAYESLEDWVSSVN